MFSKWLCALIKELRRVSTTGCDGETKEFFGHAGQYNSGREAAPGPASAFAGQTSLYLA
jgi:hypothetical protein